MNSGHHGTGIFIQKFIQGIAYCQPQAGKENKKHVGGKQGITL